MSETMPLSGEEAEGEGPGGALLAGVVAPASLSSALVPDLVEDARAYAEAALSPRTRQEYSRAWRAFVGWCASQGVAALPAAPELVALYLTSRAKAGKAPATIEQDLAAIAAAHRAAGHPSPRQAAVVRAVRGGIRRTLGVAGRQKAPLLAEQLKAVAGALPDTLRGKRDRALLLLGFAGAFRRAELVGIAVDDLVWQDAGATVRLRRSKTDQEGEGTLVGIPRGSPGSCPVLALKAWIEAAGIEEGPVFREVSRHGHLGTEPLTTWSVSRIVKRAAKSLGLDPALYGGHSLRAGLATSAALAGKQERDIMRQTRHASAAMLRRYIREAGVFDQNAAEGLL